MSGMGFEESEVRSQESGASSSRLPGGSCAGVVVALDDIVADLDGVRAGLDDVVADLPTEPPLTPNPSPQKKEGNFDEPLVSVVLPVFNESLVLPILLARVAKTLDRCPVRYELIFVNDGSSDDTPRVLDDLAATNHHVRVLHLSRNFGHQAAVQAGLRYARGDAVILMDADLQDAPEALARFIAEWQAGYHVVYAVRTQRKEAWWKRWLFAAFHRLMAGSATVATPAEAGVFGLIDRRVAREILALGEHDRYLPGLRSWVGFRQTGVVVPRGARYDRTPRVSLRGLWRLGKTAIFSFSALPLTLFYVIGALAGVTFVGLSGFALFCRLFTDEAIPGWTSNLLVASFFGMLNALGICMLGEYVVRIYDQVRNRPHFIVDRTVNVDPPADEDQHRVGQAPRA